MKPIRPKIHLLDTNDPLCIYENLECRCGLILVHAQPKFMLCDEIADEMPVPFVTCKQCLADPPGPSAIRTYIYGLVESQEERLYLASRGRVSEEEVLFSTISL